MMNDYLKDYGSGIVSFYGILKEDKWFTFENVIGTTSKESKELIKSDTKFDIASLTKTITAILIHKAVEENFFSFQTKVTEVNSSFVHLEQISIEDLLCHRIEIWTDGYLGNAKTKEEFNQILYSAYIKSANPKYVDTHYIILSNLLESIYQQDLEDLMKEKILKPLNLKNTSFYLSKSDSFASTNGELLNSELLNHEPGELHDKKARIASKLSIHTGHAGIFTTASDLFFILKELIDESEKVLKKRSKTHFFLHDNYDLYLKKCEEKKIIDIISPYTYGGMRYKIEESHNPVRVSCSIDSYLFSGYTGPLYLIDKKEKVVIVVMINSIHYSKKTRQERLNAGMEIIEKIYNKIKKEFFI